ncbi:MAG: tetratricopeptide repeat protein [Phycisphaerales bacterium]|nr:tetratricopeptide repeat protein [Phycisphaerales bacterium]
MIRPVFAVAALVVVAAFLSGCAGRTPERAEASGLHYLKVGQYERAVSDFEYAVDKEPGRFYSRLGLGEALIGAGRPDAARSHLEVAYTLRPNDSEAVEALARAMLESGDKNAMSKFLNGLASRQQRVEDWMRYGRFSRAAGDMDEARRAFLTAAKLDKGMTVEPQVALADLYEEVGDRENALRRLRMALFLAPESDELKARVRAMGETPGPTFAMRPEEAE